MDLSAIHRHHQHPLSGEVSEGDDCSSGGDQRMELQRPQRDAALSAMAPLKPPPLEVVFQPPNDPGVQDVQVDTQG